ncbi:MAG: basic secretory protein-like protein, partial [candidate division WOR-3 bacterium]
MIEFFLLVYFGKNKIQYREFDWKVAQSKHFKVFYYQGGEYLKDFAIAVLEEAFEEYKSIMPKIPKDKIPVLIYNSPEDFRQTNVIFDLIDEGVGGFTEVFKNRIVVPFFNSYEDFKHVLRHELVHAFQYEALSTTGSLLSNITRIPLWVIEGMSEYVSIGWDITGETFMRDLVLNDLVVPIERLGGYGGYLIYKQGQAVYYFIEKEYSREKVREFI